MRTLVRNKQPLWYCLYAGNTDPVDADGNYTGEPNVSYAAPVKMYANISPAKGEVNVAEFGDQDEYDKVIVMDYHDPASGLIDENTVFFVDATPSGGTSDGYDYTVYRVAKSINSVSIAIKKVPARVV